MRTITTQPAMTIVVETLAEGVMAYNHRGPADNHVPTDCSKCKAQADGIWTAMLDERMRHQAARESASMNGT